MSDGTSGPHGAPRKGRLPFREIFHRTSAVVGALTAAVILVRELLTLLAEAPSLGWRAALAQFAVRFAIKVTVVALVNCFALALPIAGFVYYIHHVAEER